MIGEQGVLVYLATDSQFIVQHVMEINGGKVGGLSFAAATAYCTFNGHFLLQFSIENAERMENCP